MSDFIRRFLDWWRRVRDVNYFPEIKWTEDFKQELVNKIKAFPTENAFSQKKIKILVFGISTHGKSSWLNSEVSALCDTILTPCHPSSGSVSITRKIMTVNPLGNITKEIADFEFLDMPGLLTLHPQDIRDVLLGHINPGTELNVRGEYSVREKFPERIIDQPEPMDRPCSVVLIVKAGHQFGNEAIEKINILHEEAGRGNFRCFLILTNIDKADGPVTMMPDIRYSSSLQKHMADVEEKSKFDHNRVFPVINYVKPRATECNMSIGHLYPLKCILDDARHEAQGRLQAVPVQH